MKKQKIENELYVMIETASAEFGSALEMLSACKNTNKASFANGYFEHASDEYNHAKSFFSMLSNRGRQVDAKTARNYRFSPNSLFPKGYISKKGFLIETMKLKDFVAYVYTNELLAKESFDKILSMVKKDTPDGYRISSIMNDELRHHGMAKSYFLKYYPWLQPWQLRLYRFKETLLNRGRKFYDKNLKFLDKVLKPVYFGVSYLAGRILLIIDLSQFQRNGKNLMDIQTKSVV